MKNKTILQICNFSSGISGVWTRVFEDSKEFIKRGYDVYVFSSNETENKESVNKNEEILEGIKIKRFNIKKRMGYALWLEGLKEEILKLNPEVVVCHGLRKPYLSIVSGIAREIGAKIFLVSHAPFADKELRSWKLNFIIWLYDKFIGKKIMNSFDKIITICKWEKEKLLELGCKEDKIVYIPNSLPDEFFTQKKTKEQKKILFLGGMNSIKRIEVLIKAFSEAKKRYHIDYVLEIVSSIGSDYYYELRRLAKELRTPVYFTEPIYDLKKKIKKIDECEIFVLPSRREAMPFGLIEAMSRGKIVVATRTKGGEELIKDIENGFLFDIGDEIGLCIILDSIASKNYNKYNKDTKGYVIREIRKNAKEKAKEFRVSNNISKWENLFERRNIMEK